MADDYVPASPILHKAKKRKAGLLQRRAKRQRRRSGKAAEVTPSTSMNDQSTTNPLENESTDEVFQESKICGESQPDITALYWPDTGGQSTTDLEGVDIFAEARLLEEANKVPIKVASKIPPTLVTGEFTTFEVFSQKVNPQSSPPKPALDTQFGTESEFLKVCEVVDAVSDLHRNIPQFSQWGSPLTKTVAASTPAPVGREQTADQNPRPSSSTAAVGLPTKSGVSPPLRRAQTSPVPGTSYSCRKYGYEIEKAARKRINFFDDSDSKSSLGSDISVQSDDGVQFTPLDSVDLNKSLHVQENLQNLSSFFSQSFVQEDVDAATNGVFRYIMKLKSKKKDVQMIHAFRSGKNFSYDHTDSSGPFEGFATEDDSESISVQSSVNNLHDLLGEDDEFFQDFAEERTKNSELTTDLDVESILRGADRALQEASQYITKKEVECLKYEEETKNTDVVAGINLDALLHGEILGTPKVAKLSENSAVELSSFQWIMRPKIHNSITASDIEFDSEPKDEKYAIKDDSPTLLNVTFTVTKSPANKDEQIISDDEISHFILEANTSVEDDINVKSYLESVASERENIPKADLAFHGKELIHGKLHIENPFLNIKLSNANFNDSNQGANGYLGFTSASGKALKISEKALEAAKKIMDKEMQLELENVPTVNNRSMAGSNDVGKFKSPAAISTKNMPSQIDYKGNIEVRNCVMENSRKNAKLGMAGVESPLSHAPRSLMTSFQSASGRNLFISHAAQQKAEQLVAECEKDVPKINADEENNINLQNPSSSDAKSKNMLSKCSSRQMAVKNSLLAVQTKPIDKRSFLRNSADVIEDINARANPKMSANMNQKKSDSSKHMSILEQSSNISSKSLTGFGVPQNDGWESNLHFEPSTHIGFQSASGKKISVSEVAQQRAVKMMLEEMNAANIDLPAVGNSTPHFEKVGNSKVSMQLGSAKSNSTNNVTQENVPEQIEENIKPTKNFVLNCGFKTAAGSCIKITDAARLKAEKVIAEIDNGEAMGKLSNAPWHNNLRKDGEENLIKTNSDQLAIVGFQDASGKTIKVSEKAMALAENMMEEEGDDILANVKLSQIRNAVVGHGNNENITKAADSTEKRMDSSAKVKHASERSYCTKRILRSNASRNETNASVELALNPAPSSKIQLSSSDLMDPNETNSRDVCDENIARNFGVLESIPSNKQVPQCRSLAKRVLRSNSVENNSKTILENSITTPNRKESPLTTASDSLTPLRSVSEFTASKNRLSLSRKRFNSPAVASGKSETPIRPTPFPSKIATPNLQEFFDSVETSTPKNCSKSRARQKLTESQEVSASKTALLEDEAETGSIQSGVRKISWDLGFEESSKASSPTSCEKASLVILSRRAQKRHEQMELIKSKNHFQGYLKGGFLFVNKSRPNRMKLNDLIKGSEERIPTPMKPSDALNYKFVASNDEISIETQDECYIVPDDENKVGLDEIRNAFLSIPSVAPNLIPFNWIQHHYEMIILKLHWLETFLPGSLTSQNVCLQLKYRYDHEIDRTHRSALRRILEMDDSPAKRLILIVADIHYTEFNTEIELSDRWYTIRAVIDPAMQSLVDEGKVKVETKLMIQSSELLNCNEGCSPLEIPENVRLKIHTNSIRRARWDTKLGFYKVKRPFLLGLKQVRVHGGLITKLELCILRVYPSLYLKGSNKYGNVSEFHSEKVEQQHQNQQDISKLENIEAIFSEVQKEIETEERESSAIKYGIRRNIKEISDPIELYNILRWEGDTSEIEAELTSDQRNLLADYKQRVHAEQMKEIQKRVQDRLQNQPTLERSRELLKLRVGDCRCPSTTAILSIWSPHPETKSLLRECSVVEATHLLPKEHHSLEVQLASTKMSQFKRLRDMKDHIADQRQSVPTVPTHFFRHVSVIKEIQLPSFKPAFNELDTCGLVVMVGDDDTTRNCQAKKFQPVYIADSDENILCLNFWIGVKNYGYEDVIQVHRFVTANNLQWRSNSASGPIPIAFVTPSTVFTEKPKNQDMLHALETLKAHFQNSIDEKNTTREFVERCQEKIKEIKSRPKCLSNSTLSALSASSRLNNSNNSSANNHTSTSMNASTSSNNSSSTIVGKPSVQERIEKIKIYGNPPNISPILVKRTRSVRRGFKVPSRIPDNGVS